MEKINSWYGTKNKLTMIESFEEEDDKLKIRKTKKAQTKKKV